MEQDLSWKYERQPTLGKNHSLLLHAPSFDNYYAKLIYLLHWLTQYLQQIFFRIE